MGDTFKLSEQSMIALLFLLQRSMYAAAIGEEENFQQRAAALNFAIGDDGRLYCVNPPGVDAINVDKLQDDEGFLDLEDE